MDSRSVQGIEAVRDDLSIFPMLNGDLVETLEAEVLMLVFIMPLGHRHIFTHGSSVNFRLQPRFNTLEKIRFPVFRFLNSLGYDIVLFYDNTIRVVILFHGFEN